MKLETLRLRYEKQLSILRRALDRAEERVVNHPHEAVEPIVTTVESLKDEIKALKDDVKVLKEKAK